MEKDKQQVSFAYTFWNCIHLRMSQQLQGTLIVTLRNSASGQPIDDNEVRRKFQQFGDVKSVRPVGERPEYVNDYRARDYR